MLINLLAPTVPRLCRVRGSRSTKDNALFEYGHRQPRENKTNRVVGWLVGQQQRNNIHCSVNECVSE